MAYFKSGFAMGITVVAIAFGLGATLAPNDAHSAETIGKFTVQVAAFDDETKAKEFTADLKTKGLKPFIIPVQLKGRPWYRVGIGLFATESETVRFRTQLLSKTKLPEAIIRVVD